LGERDEVQREVELAVTAAGQAVACAVATGGRSRSAQKHATAIPVPGSERLRLFLFFV
jgi:hypothetical protein